MALADAISTPQVGQTMLKTFATLSEENRRRKELEINQEKVVQGLAMKEAMNDIRQRGLDERVRQFDERQDLANKLYDLKELDSVARRGKLEVDTETAKVRQLAEVRDAANAKVFSDLVHQPQDNKPPLAHRLLSMDSKVKQDAYAELAQLSVGMSGKKGGYVDTILNNLEGVIEKADKDKYAALRASVAADREKRMAEDQNKDNTRADLSLEERKRQAQVREAAAAAKAAGGGAGSTKSGAATVTRTTVSPEKDAKTVVRGTPAQVAAAKRIEELAKEPETFVNAIGETKAQEIARLNAVLSGPAAATAQVAPATVTPAAAQRPRQGEIRVDANGRKAQWVGGEDGEINDPVNWRPIK